MSKRRRFKEDKSTPIAVTESDVIKPAPTEPTNGERRVVKKAQQCPVCYDNLGGVGTRRWQRQVNGPLVKRCYSCNQCGIQWTVDIRTDEDDGVEVVTTTVVRIEK